MYNLERPARTSDWEITCVTFSNNIFIFTLFDTQTVLKKQISLFNLGQAES